MRFEPSKHSAPDRHQGGCAAGRDVEAMKKFLSRRRDDALQFKQVFSRRLIAVTIRNAQDMLWIGGEFLYQQVEEKRHPRFGKFVTCGERRARVHGAGNFAAVRHEGLAEYNSFPCLATQTRPSTRIGGYDQTF